MFCFLVESLENILKRNTIQSSLLKWRDYSVQVNSALFYGVACYVYRAFSGLYEYVLLYSSLLSFLLCFQLALYTLPLFLKGRSVISITNHLTSLLQHHSSILLFFVSTHLSFHFSISEWVSIFFVLFWWESIR